MDHEAIRKAYPNAITIDDSGLILDASGNNVSVEQSKVDAARVELDKVKYKKERLFGSTKYEDWRARV